jgi:DegV family protein with EDD domain
MTSKQVAVLTDSVSCMSSEIAQEYDIKVLPTSVVIDGKSYYENEVNLDEFCRKLPEWQAAGRRPTSSGVTTGAFVEAYRELSQKAKSILCICASHKLSVILNAAQQAKANVKVELPDTEIEVINSYTNCGAQMLIALEAARAANQGKSPTEVVQVAKDMMKKINQVVMMDDISFLAKGGRAHKATAWADSAVTQTSMVEMKESTGGEFVPIARCRTKGQTRDTLFDLITQRSGGKKLHVVIDHACLAQVEAEDLKDKALSQFSCEEVFIDKIGPLITLYVERTARVFSWWAE